MSRSPQWTVGTIVLLVLLTYLGATAYEAHSGYRAAVRRAETQAQSYARTLEEHVVRAIGEGDRALSNMAANLRRELVDPSLTTLADLAPVAGSAQRHAAVLAQAERTKFASEYHRDLDLALETIQRSLEGLSAVLPRLLETDLRGDVLQTSLAMTGALRRAIRVLSANAAAIDTSLWEHFTSVIEQGGAIDNTVQEVIVRRRSTIVRQLAPADEATVHKMLRRVTDDLPQIRSFALINTLGQWTAESKTLPHRLFNSADRVYFQRHRDEPNTGLIVESVIYPRDTTERFVTLSRRLEDAEGRFGGVVAAALDVNYFTGFYRAIALPKNTVVQVSDRSGRVMIAEPEGNTGDVPISPVHRIVGERVLADLPLTVSVLLDRDVALADWRHDVARTITLALLLVVAVVALALKLNATLRQQARSARALAEREEDYRSIFDNAREGLFRTTRDGRIVRANEAFLRMFGYRSLGEALAIDDIARRVWVDPVQRAHMLDEIGRTGEIKDFVFTARRQDNAEEVKISMTARLARTAEQDCIEGYCLDVTERLREAEALRQARWAAEDANRAKSHFLANMSHELRTPLNAILGFSEVIRDQLFGPDAERYAQYGGDIHASGLHLLSLIDEVLDLSKIEAGRYELSREMVDVGEPIAECVRMVERRARAGAIELQTEVDPYLPPIVGDRRVIRQVVLNLVSNAVKFTPAGGAVIIGARREGDCIAIRVADTGIGVSPSDLPYVFEPFRRADSAVKRAVEGSGLGLAITRRFVEMHDGTVELTSTLGAGTTVTARLPLPIAA